MKTKLSLLALIVLTGCVSPPGTEPTGPRPQITGPSGSSDKLVKQEVTVSRHRKAPPLDNKRADRILAAATRALADNKSEGDTDCKVALVRKGNVTEFSTGDGSIDSGAEFYALAKQPGAVKLVDEINWCNGFVPGAIGCAHQGGSLVIESYPPIDGILWAHEYGHTKGLSHRDVRNALLAPGIDTNCNCVNRTECSAFRR